MSKRLVILGGGESGVGAALLAKKKGYDIVLMDEGSLKDGYRKELQQAEIPFIENGIDEEKLLTADEVVKSPGIPEKNEWVKKLRKKDIPIISEIELAFRHKGNSKIIAITGSNGKSTTTALIFHICETAGLNSLDCAHVVPTRSALNAIHSAFMQGSKVLRTRSLVAAISKARTQFTGCYRTGLSRRIATVERSIV